jgi:hypothetical protein
MASLEQSVHSHLNGCLLLRKPNLYLMYHLKRKGTVTLGLRRITPVLLNFLHEFNVSAEGQAAISSTADWSCSHTICWGKSHTDFGRSGIETNSTSLAKHTRIL